MFRPYSTPVIAPRLFVFAALLLCDTNVSAADTEGDRARSVVAQQATPNGAAKSDAGTTTPGDSESSAVHERRPLIRPSDADLDEIAAILNESKAITI